jgi:hypothetical protein
MNNKETVATGKEDQVKAAANEFAAAFIVLCAKFNGKLKGINAPLFEQSGEVIHGEDRNDSVLSFLSKKGHTLPVLVKEALFVSLSKEDKELHFQPLLAGIEKMASSHYYDKRISDRIIQNCKTNHKPKP